MAVALAGPYATICTSGLILMYSCHLVAVIKWIRCIVLCYVTSFQIDNDANTSSLNFMGPMLFLTPKQQCQRPKGTVSNHKFIGHFTMSYSSPSCSGMAHVNGDHNLLATHKWNKPYLPLLFLPKSFTTLRPRLTSYIAEGMRLTWPRWLGYMHTVVWVWGSLVWTCSPFQINDDINKTTAMPFKATHIILKSKRQASVKHNKSTDAFGAIYWNGLVMYQSGRPMPTQIRSPILVLTGLDTE